MQFIIMVLHAVLVTGDDSTTALSGLESLRAKPVQYVALGNLMDLDLSLLCHLDDSSVGVGPPGHYFDW